jgi:hypothetical protein
MTSTYDDNLLKQAVIHYKAGEIEAARRYLERALDLADDYKTRVDGNFLMSQIENAPAKKREYLENVLAIDRMHAPARRALAILDGKLAPDELVDPEATPVAAPSNAPAQAERFTCPKCGGRMTFAPDGRTLTCEYCDRAQTLTGNQAEQKDFILSMATGHGNRAPVNLRVFACRGCGADFVLPPQVISTLCAYCGSAHVTETGSRDLLEPDAIIPMAFNQRQAAQLLIKWVEGNKIVPQGKVHAPRGLYLPVWTFDLYGTMPWNGEKVERKRVVRLSGERSVAHQNVFVPAANKLPPFFRHTLPDFKREGLIAYDPRYLAGWHAEVYDLTMAQASLLARESVQKLEAAKIRAEMVELRNLRFSLPNLAIESFQLVLLPIWLTEYPYDGETHPILINGQTGELYGETPRRGFTDWLGNLFRDNE